MRFRKQLNAKISFAPLAPGLRHAEPQSDARSTPLGPNKNETRCTGRFKVCIIRYGIRLLDCDNLAGGCKAIIDALRYEYILPNDDPASVEIIFKQEKVKRKDIGTKIIIEKII